jgi:hypothetical protein
MKTVAVIPVHGRLPLLKHTVNRLVFKNDVNDIILVGSKEDSQKYKGIYTEWVYMPNDKLGAKWNKGFQVAKHYNPDAVLYVGSSDWVSDDWVQTIGLWLEHCDMVGKLDYNLAHVGKTIKQYKFKGYTDPKFNVKNLLVTQSLRSFLFGNDRTGESIGIGRMIRADFLNKINWKPFLDDYNKSLDWCMMQKLRFMDGRVNIVKDDSIESLAISCDLWPNMHWKSLSRFAPNTEKTKNLELIFPELKTFQHEVQQMLNR